MQELKLVLDSAKRQAVAQKICKQFFDMSYQSS